MKTERRLNIPSMIQFLDNLQLHPLKEGKHSFAKDDGYRVEIVNPKYQSTRVTFIYYKRSIFTLESLTRNVRYIDDQIEEVMLEWIDKYMKKHPEFLI